MKKRILSIILVVAMVLSVAPTSTATESLENIEENTVVACEECGESEGHLETCSLHTEETIVEPDALDLQNTFSLSSSKSLEYIYFDLYYGDVTIKSGSYSGYVSDGNGGKRAVTGTHNADNKYYIYQSDGTTGDILPEYERVMDGKWGEYITNNTDVLDVIEKWKTEAAAVGRSETPVEIKLNENGVDDKGNKIPDVNVPMHHRIDILSAESVTTNFDVTLDNIWSGFQNDDCRNAQGEFYKLDEIKEGPHYRTTGGLTFRPQNKTTTANIKLVGDNRFGNIHYEVGGGAGGVAGCKTSEIDSKVEQMFFSDASQDGIPATLTVANLDGDNGYNHFCAVIGGANNPDYVPGLVFESGVIYAGATELDNCTAIGGGGCGFGGVTINGGTITAVTATNGAAIGGGIGDGSNGGAADIEITGGTVYAYNKGLAIEGTRESRGVEGSIAGQVIYAAMPAVAIGSGSSRRQWTVPAKINISGGTVYAESVGGTAIGGGSSVNYQGADADVTISNGAIVTAKSISGNVTVIHEYDSGIAPTYVGRKESISASTSIGGGTAGVPFRTQGSTTTLLPQGNGGTATLSISGENTKVYAGSIGGGGVNALKDDPFPNSVNRPADGVGKIGAAHVTINSGSVQGQVIMAKGGTEDCSFSMIGGTIDNSTKDDTFTFLKEDGGAVWIENGNATLSGGTIKNASAKNGGAFYVAGGAFVMSGGTITNCKALEGNGGAVCVTSGTCNLTGGTISQNTASENGGALYVEHTPVTLGGTTGISILENKATKNGGGIYTNQGNVSIENGTINSNEAANGGGIYAINGSDITMSGEKAFLTSNKANGLPDSQVTTAYNKSTELTGVGGGVFIANGVDANNTTLFKMSAQKVGIYGNSAGFAADDVFANGNNTKLEVPDVKTMDLAGVEGVKPTGWFEDYVEGDTAYSNGLNGNPSVGGKRYKTAGINVVEIENHETANAQNTYVCMTLGLGRGNLTIKKVAGSGTTIDENQTFLFHLTGTPLDGSGDIDLYVTIKGEGSETVYNLPYGNYTISECSDWSWRYDEQKCELITTDSNNNQSTSLSSKTLLNDNNKNPEFKITNALTNEKWLSFEQSINNIFGKANQ